MSWMFQEGVFHKEYLVTPEFMIKTMKDKCNARLVDTDSFSNFYNLNRPWFKEVTEFEENPRNKKFYKDVGSFYGDLKGSDKESRTFSHLSRYYVFQKM